MRHLRLGVALAALAVPAFVIPAAVQAQETSAIIRGTVVDAGNKPIPGAQVVVTHAPSGTRTTQVTDSTGTFNVSGLRIGGPFTISVSGDGYETAETQIESLFANQPQRISVQLADAGQVITVTAARVQRSAISLGGGPATVLTARDIKGVATATRDIRNLAARDPLVSLDPSAQNNGISISIAGQNNRFNRITVDGISFGDPFGLESGGLASSRGPVPIDAIAEFSVESAPIDIQQGFFQGGAINTQLKSGSNNFSATGFVTYQDNALRGKTTRGQRREDVFESQNYGLQVTGPIIKDRLFFAVTWERLRDSVPANVTAAVAGVSDAQLTNVTQILNSRYRYDPLGVPDQVSESDDKLVAKFDLNIADGHRASFTYIYNKGNILAGQTGDNNVAGQIANPTLSLQSNSYEQGSINHFGVFQLNDQWSDNFSTQLRVSYQDYERLQAPYNGRDFGQFQVCLTPGATVGSPSPLCPSNVPRIQLGPDVSRQANELTSQSLNVEFQAQLKMRNHTVKLIAERRTQNVNNLFAQNVSGNFRFDSIADLQAGRANQLVFAQPLLGGVDTTRALFENNTWTFGVQDTIDLSDTLVVTAGFRYDLFDTPDVPRFNQAFTDRLGFANNSSLNGRSLFQPRFGLQWNPSSRLTVRGTAGMYGGGNPGVWISNNYSNPGPLLGSATVNRLANGTFTVQGAGALTTAQQQEIGAATLNNVTGGPGVPAILRNAIIAQGAATATTNVLDPEFRVPSQWRLTGSVDYKANLGFLGDDWNLGADVIWSRVRDALDWTDLRSVASGTLPDGRVRFRDSGVGANTDMFLTNTDLGYSWNVVARFDKRWTNGFRLAGSYTFSRVNDVNSGLSSVAFSNYSNSAAGIDPNAAAYGTSIFQTDDAFRLVASYDANLFGDNNTRFELFFNSRAGQRFSHTMADTTAGNTNRGSVFGVLGNNNRQLLYVPNVSSATADARVVYAPGFNFAAFQSYIQNSGLGDFQGQIAPKNVGIGPRFNKLDLAVRQEVPFVFGGKIELFADMENLLNFINSDWGSVRRVGFPGYGRVVNVTCLQPNGTAATLTQTCAQYQFNGYSEPTETLIRAPSLWQLRIGARLSF